MQITPEKIKHWLWGHTYLYLNPGSAIYYSCDFGKQLLFINWFLQRLAPFNIVENTSCCWVTTNGFFPTKLCILLQILTPIPPSHTHTQPHTSNSLSWESYSTLFPDRNLSLIIYSFSQWKFTEHLPHASHSVSVPQDTPVHRTESGSSIHGAYLSVGDADDK